MLNARAHSIVFILFLSSSTLCPVPAESTDRVLKIYDWDHRLINDRTPGVLVPKFTQIESECCEGYVHTDGKNTSSAYCNYIGTWHPELEPCDRVCPTLRTSNVVLTCKDKRGGIIDCNGPLLRGSQVTAHCMPLHQIDPLARTETDYIRCRDDGRWDKELIKCVPDCGIPLHQPLIANGSDTQFGEFPWHVAIYKVPLGNRYICGGTLITPNMVLSAAHCFYNESKGVASKNPGDYEIIVGKMTSDYNRVDNFEQQKFQGTWAPRQGGSEEFRARARARAVTYTYTDVSEIQFAPNEYNSAVSYGSDIAIIILKGNITISQYVLPACFSRPERSGFKPEKNTEGALPGWGLDENDDVSRTLKMARLPFVDYNTCSKKVAHVTIDKFCAGAQTGPRPLRGDSGGGLVFKEGLFYYVRGIVSTRGKWSDSSLTTFTDISFYQDWIESVIQRGASRKTTNDERRTSTDGTPFPSSETSTSGAINSTKTTPKPTRTPLPTEPATHWTTPDAKCKALSTPNIGWSCKRVADCKLASTLLSTSQDYRCGSSRENICCPEQKSTSTSTVVAPASKPVPNHIRIVEQKCLEYAEARYQNVCTIRQVGVKTTCRRVLDCDRVETLIVGGTEAKPKEFPHMALLGHGKAIDDITWLCSGTLISERFILTVAHCAGHQDNFDPVSWVGLGFVDKAELTPAALNRKIFEVGKTYIHPSYKQPLINHDIGLIQLKNSIKFSPYIRPICLHTSEYVIPQKSLNDTTIAGWGRTATDEVESELLLKATLRILPNELCTDTYKDHQNLGSGFDGKNMICAGFPESNTDTCAGDSGGPIQIKHSMECMYTQLGISSFGPLTCGEGEATGYTRVSSYLDWIQKIVWP